VRWAFPGSQETFSFEQFESQFHRPDIVRLRLAGKKDAGRPVPNIGRPPTIDMPDYLSFRTVQTDSYTLKMTVSSPDVVKTVHIFNNGKALLELPVNKRHITLSPKVKLFSGANRITAVAHDEHGFSSNPKYLDVLCEAPSFSRPGLYVLSIGSSRYAKMSSQWQLSFAHTDARAIVDVFKRQKSDLFDRVEYTLLTNADVTVQTIKGALEDLTKISENDLAVIFMAGHGVKGPDGTFYFLTSEGSADNPEAGGLSWSMLGDYLTTIKGRVILMLDACHSGGIVTETVVPNDDLAEDFLIGKRGGIMVFSASKGRQYSFESPDIGDGFGVFTYALVRGIGSDAGNADVNENGFVEFMELVDYVKGYVDQLTNGQQTPWLSRKEMFGDIPIAVVNN